MTELGTSRIIIDKTGALANVKRHDSDVTTGRDRVNLADPAALNYILTGHTGNQSVHAIPQ